MSALGLSDAGVKIRTELTEITELSALVTEITELPALLIELTELATLPCN